MAGGGGAFWGVRGQSGRGFAGWPSRPELGYLSTRREGGAYLRAGGRSEARIKVVNLICEDKSCKLNLRY